MASREDLKTWVIEALKAYGGSARIVQICEYIWNKYEAELRESGDLFYVWQYNMRWVGTQLRKEGVLQPNPPGIRPWRLAK